MNMTPDQNDFRPAIVALPFAAEKDAQDFMHELIVALIREIDRRRVQHISPENVQIFNHGTDWTFQREEKEGFSLQTGELELHSVRCAISTDRILEHDVTLVSDFMKTTAEQFDHGLSQRLFAEVEAVAEETGNTIVFPKEGSLKNAFLELIRGTHLFVGPDGSVTRPTLFLNPATYERFQQQAERRDPEAEKEVEALWKQKEDEARQREAERLARYQD
jgi:hypothetical protein